MYPSYSALGQHAAELTIAMIAAHPYQPTKDFIWYLLGACLTLR